jgi:hypothetical protein
MVIDEVNVNLRSVVVDRLTEECGLIVVVFDVGEVFFFEVNGFPVRNVVNFVSS